MAERLRGSAGLSIDPETVPGIAGARIRESNSNTAATNTMQAGTITYIMPSGQGIRLSQRDAPGAIAVGAISRLKALEPILRYAKTVRVYSGTDAVTAFELVIPDAVFIFVLSANAARGFSGEGQALSGLSQETAPQLLAQIRGALNWQTNLSPESLSAKLNLDRESTENALQVLGSRGLVGYDLSNSSYFHRELPFDLTLVEELHPRMKKRDNWWKKKASAFPISPPKTITKHLSKALKATITYRLHQTVADALAIGSRRIKVQEDLSLIHI